MRQIYSRRIAQSFAVAETKDPQPGSSLTGAEALSLCAAFESLNLGRFWITDADGRLRYISPDANDILTRGDGAAGQSFLSLFVPPRDGIDGQRTLPFVLSRRARFGNVVARTENDKRDFIWSVSGEPCTDATGMFKGFRGHIVDVTRERQSADETSQMAMNDALTGLLNRRHMTTVLERTIAAYAPTRRACATMLIDLDRFKQVNDTLGHAVGDALLKQVAQRLIKVIGKTEKLCRLGGDEFQVMLPDVDDRARLGEIAENIIIALSEPYSIEGNRCMIGASVGVAIFPNDGANADELVRNADLALYDAKHGGRGTHRFYSAELLEVAEKRKQLEYDLHDALTRGEFELAYQPLVKIEDNQVVGTEALVRWNHPERGSISPAIFIPIAEESTAICRLGEWILRTACADAAQWSNTIRVAVNVSPVQFADRQLPRIVASALASAGLSPDRLELEITEGVFLQDSAATTAMFTALKRLGVRLVLDDFGTGYSSLSYLRNAPFDKIKIDQSFIRSATSNEARNRAIISAIVTLADSLGMEIIAEGVESFDQLEMVRDLKVSHVQGYIFSRPIAVADLQSAMTAETWTIKPAGPARQRHDRIAMFRSIGVIHEDHYYPVTLRNISLSGALIEGILEVPVGTQFMIDFGEGQFEMHKEDLIYEVVHPSARSYK